MPVVVIDAELVEPAKELLAQVARDLRSNEAHQPAVHHVHGAHHHLGEEEHADQEEQPQDVLIQAGVGRQDGAGDRAPEREREAERGLACRLHAHHVVHQQTDEAGRDHLQRDDHDEDATA